MFDVWCVGPSSDTCTTNVIVFTMLRETFCVPFCTHAGSANDPPLEPPPDPPPLPPDPPPLPPDPDEPGTMAWPYTLITTVFPSLPVTVTCAVRTPGAEGLKFTAI